MAGAAGTPRPWPVRGPAGLALIALFWTLNWSLPGLRTHWGFFPLWLGYALVADALVFRAKGHSLITRNPAAFAGLFVASAPAWWLFEGINVRTQNWFYLGEEAFSPLEFALLSTVSFSTVMPAVFGTAEWVGTWKWVGGIGRGPALHPTRAFLASMFGLGGLMLLLIVLWPDTFFPLVWGSLYCLIEPVNAKLGNRTLLEDLARGDWRTAVALAAGALICGFFWEMWNFYSYPKWIYRIPYADWIHLFEMPLAGYLGYIPFSWELFALYHLLTGPLRRDRNRRALCLVEDAP